MGRPRGVKADTVKLDLSDGDWIEVKRILTVGEERDLVSLAVRGYRPDGTADLDTRLLSFLAAATYIQAWSFVGVNGLPIPWMPGASITQRVDVLRTLDTATMGEVDAALDAHRKAEAAAKNAHSGGTGTEATSPSAAA